MELHGRCNQPWPILVILAGHAMNIRDLCGQCPGCVLSRALRLDLARALWAWRTFHSITHVRTTFQAFIGRLPTRGGYSFNPALTEPFGSNPCWRRPLCGTYRSVANRGTVWAPQTSSAPGGGFLV